MPQAKIHLPQIQTVTLRGLSLFPDHPAISLNFSHDVLCFAGANGIGKSTLLAAISYGLTGIVAEPSRKFASVEEYYKDCAKFAQSYFSGRVAEQDRDRAQIDLQFALHDHQYELSRGLFEPETLRSLTIRSEEEVEYDGENASPESREEFYRVSVAGGVGVRRFQQYSFLHHFVFTFDERHSLLFWEQPVLEQALYLAFGVDFQTAQRADELRRQVEKADSRRRNASWAAAEIAKKISELSAKRMASVDEQPDEILEQYHRLQIHKEAAIENVNQCTSRLGDAELYQARAAGRVAETQLLFNQLFTRQAETRRPWSRHYLFEVSRSAGRCALCSDASSDLELRLSLSAEGPQCPLCGAEAEPAHPAVEIDEQLFSLDRDLDECRTTLTDATARVERCKAELRNSNSELELVTGQISVLEAANPWITYRRASEAAGLSELDAILATYQRQHDEAIAEKAQHLQRREVAATELRKLRETLEDVYAEAEGEFVPSFRDLAHLFLGMDLDVELQRQGTGVQLVVEVRGEKRRTDYSLSESQKFFVDIALRMALAKHMVSANTPACLFVDTPEGSLDIAYEARAGAMFARFVEQGNRVLLTANVNSSRLLLRLAEKCGRSRVKFIRMIEWAHLSEVQLEESDLFDQAFLVIEEALDKHSAPLVT